MTTSEAGFWDEWGADRASRNSGVREFRWTQYEGHGPGVELLGDPDSALELGSGAGDAAGALAERGVRVTGIDVSPFQCDQAARHWADQPNVEFVHTDVLDYLRASTRRWDAIYSIWGALWFTDPALLLPLVRDHLEPGGHLVFSHAPPIPGCYGAQGMYAAGFHGRRVWVRRWAHEPQGWADLLAAHGFTSINAWVQPAPDPELLGTLIVTANRPRV
ncbi:class I SAM-dependent methyltransferase [Spiractinospora alimapuensis]|uniref:class I SAM-dependent methyltransferase n=1 Tax=Spiractinospora alimapuensis TaxID=2820884 RepID=UPI001F2CFADB|nr:class I SAM-dependent methyltransferase [Spiractinospora alimapuensis]